MDALALTMPDQPEHLNLVVRDHEVRTQWQFQPLASLTFRFIDLFDREFFLGRLPPCFLRFDAEARGKLVRFHRGRNSVGARHDLNINPRLFPVPPAEFLAELLHQLNHSYQESAGTPGKTTWHNHAFLSKAKELGIPCAAGRACSTLAYTDPFLALLKRLGITSLENPSNRWRIEFDGAFSRAGVASRRPKLRKFSCGCTNIWAAVEVRAQCCRCENLFSSDAQPGRAGARAKSLILVEEHD